MIATQRCHNLPEAIQRWDCERERRDMVVDYSRVFFLPGCWEVGVMLIGPRANWFFNPIASYHQQ